MIEGMIRRNPDLSDREIARQIGVSNSTVWRSEGLVNSPEVQRYRKFKAQWERFSDAECAVFVRDHLKDTKYLVAEAEKSNGQNPKTLREFWAVRVEC
jgi:IS30 family transposase